MGSYSMVAWLIVGVMLVLAYKGGTVADVSNGRLPQNFKPYHYNVELTPDIYRTSEPFPFNGSVQIYLTCEVASNVVTINSKGLMIDNSSVKISLVPGQSGAPETPVLSNWIDVQKSGFFHFQTTESLTPNVSYILEMNFNGAFKIFKAGINCDYYISSNGSIKYLAWTQFEPHSGRLAFPGFDEPDFKATFNMTIVRKPPAVSAGNAVLLQTIDRGDGWLADVYATTPKMSLYLVAFGVGELQKLSAGRVNGYEVNVWARSEIVPYMNFTLNSAPKIQAWLDNETGITYREAKSDHLMVPNKNGAMEHWGLITFSEMFVVYNSETSSAYGKQAIGFIQSHEISHMWYGNLVTCKWWDDFWLNEGFATYYDYRATQALGWEGSEASQVKIQEFMATDERNSSVPVRILYPDVTSSAGILRAVSTYTKGAAMVHMLECILTTSTFKAGMTKYLLKHQYKTVTTDDLWQTLNEQAAIDGIKNPNGSALDLKLRMDPWLNQRGFPLVIVTRNANGTAMLTRRHFLSPRSQDVGPPSPYNYKWDVPITIVSAESGPGAWDAPPSTWIDIGVINTTIPGFPTDRSKWAVVNAKFGMYYRVMYDIKSLAAIVSQLIRDHTAIHVESRSQIIDDAFSVARAAYFAEAVAMETTRYLVNETKWGPWNAALKHLKHSDRLLRNQSWGGLLRTYMLGLTVPVYRRLGWTYSDTETPFQQFLRRDAISVACNYGHADCLTEARSQYARVVANPDANVVDPNNLPTVLCVGVREGTEADWQMSFNQYLARRRTSQIPEERHAFLYGCSCTTNTTLLDRLVVEFGRFGPHPVPFAEYYDKHIIAGYLSQSESGAQVLWNYLDVKVHNLSLGLNGVSYLRYSTIGFSTQTELDQLLAFKSRHPPKSASEIAGYTNIILDIENNIRWSNPAHLSLLERWLRRYQPSSAIRMKRANDDGGAPFALPVQSMEHWRGVHENYHSQLNHF